MKRWWWLLPLIEAAALWRMRQLHDLRAHAAAFLVCFTVAFAAFALAARAAIARRDTTTPELRHAPWLIVLIALAFRLILLPLTPTLSDDIYRYLWDGRVQLAGINPYAYAPNAPELAPLRTRDYAALNHHDIATVYPPLTEWMFRCAAAIHPTLAAQKLMFVLWDVLLMALLLVALPRWGIPRAWAILYAWHPLVIVEVAGSGHNDVLGLFWLVLGCWLWTRERPAWKRAAAVAWGLCCLSKFVSLLLIPWLLLRRDCRRYIGWFALTATVGYLPYLAGGAARLFGGLRHFSAPWEFNSFGYALLLRVWPQPAMVRALLLACLGAWALWVAARQDDLPSYLLATLGAAALVAPVIEPWYIVWLLPFVCVRPRWSWLAFSGLVMLSYMVLIGYVRDGIWHVPLWVKVVEYGTLVGMLTWEWSPRQLGGAPGGDARAAPPRRRFASVACRSLVPPAVHTYPQNVSETFSRAGRRDTVAARCATDPAAAHPLAPRLQHISVIIPALNEEEGLKATLAEIPRDIVREMIVVDNGSTDGTADVAVAAGARVVSEPRRGYGQACLTGIAALSPAADIVVFVDADHSDYPEEMAQLIAPMQRNEADLVIGSRVLGGALPGSLTPQQRVGNWLACRLIAARFGIRYTDLGPFRAIRRTTLAALQMQDAACGWTVEMQIKAATQGCRITEVPVRYRPRIGRSKISGTWRGSVRAGVTILRTIAKAAPLKR